MTYRILVLGCSFSAGYYTVDQHGVENPHSESGWWSELNPHYQYDVYSFFGGGYFNYAHLLTQLDTSVYDAVIIQESWEPRVSVYGNTEWLPAQTHDNVTVYHKQEKNRKLFAVDINNKPFIAADVGLRYQTEFLSGHSQYLTDLGNNPYVTNTVYASAAMVAHLLKDLPVFSFGLHNAVDFSPYTDFTQMPFDQAAFNGLFYTDGHNYQLDTDFCGHFNQAGTQQFAQLVKAAAEDTRYPPGCHIRF